MRRRFPGKFGLGVSHLESDADTYWFRPRGLDLSKTYNVTFSNSGRTLTIAGDRLMEAGIPVRLEGNLTSELLIFRAQ